MKISAIMVAKDLWYVFAILIKNYISPDLELLMHLFHYNENFH